MKLKIINRDYSLLLAGQLISLMGNIINGLATMWIVYDIFGSGSKTGLLFGLATIPAIALTPFAGNLADMLNRKYLLFCCDLFSGINSLLLFWLALNGRLAFANVLVILSIDAILFSFLATVRSSLIQHLVRENEYLKANSINVMASNLAQICLPTLGALLIAKFQVSYCFLIDAITFFVSAGFTLLITSYTFESKKKKAFFTEFVAGFQYLRNNFTFLYIILVFTVLNFIVTADTMLVRVLLEDKQLSVNYFGYFQTILAVGSIVMSIVLSKLENKAETLIHREKTYMSRSIALVAIAFLCFGLFGRVRFLLLGALLLGCGATWLNVTFFAYMQGNIDREFYGRVISLLFFISEIAKPLSYSFFGFLSDILPVYLIFIGDFVLLLGIFLVFKYFVKLHFKQNAQNAEVISG